jgi:Bacterial Ig domain
MFKVHHIFLSFLLLPFLLTACPQSDDKSPPVAAITSPANDQSVSGTTSIQIDATDNTRVARVSVFMRSQGSTAQGTLVGSAISRPFVISWNTSRVPNNSDLELVAIAEDGAGNKGESTPVRFRTNNANVPVLVYLVAYTLPPNGTAPSGSKPDTASTRGLSNTSLGLVNPALVVPPDGTTDSSVAKAKNALQTRASSPRAPLSNRSTVIEWAWQPLGSADGYGTYLAPKLEGAYVLNGRQSAVASAALQKRSPTLTNVSAGDSYFGTVTAVTNGATLEGGFSNADGTTFLPGQESASPSGGQSVVGGRPTLTWTALPGAIGYLYRIYTKDPLVDRTDPICSNGDASTNQLSVFYPTSSLNCPAQLPPGTYYWWVAGVSFDALLKADAFSFSNVRSFIVP